MASSKLKTAILRVLKSEGFIADFNIGDDAGKPLLTVDLKYYDGRRSSIAWSASAARAAYLPRQEDLPRVLGGNGTVIVSTPRRDDRQGGARHRAGRRGDLHRGLRASAAVQADEYRIYSESQSKVANPPALMVTTPAAT